jgi:hypothetical protein
MDGHAPEEEIGQGGEQGEKGVQAKFGQPPVGDAGRQDAEGSMGDVDAPPPP